MATMTNEDLRHWRIRHQLTQPALAELLGVSLAAIKHWEAGRRWNPLLPLAIEALEMQLKQQRDKKRR